MRWRSSRARCDPEYARAPRSQNPGPPRPFERARGPVPNRLVCSNLPCSTVEHASPSRDSCQRSVTVAGGRLFLLSEPLLEFAERELLVGNRVGEDRQPQEATSVFTTRRRSSYTFSEIDRGVGQGHSSDSIPRQVPECDSRVPPWNSLLSSTQECQLAATVPRGTVREADTAGEGRGTRCSLGDRLHRGPRSPRKGATDRAFVSLPRPSHGSRVGAGRIAAPIPVIDTDECARIRWIASNEPRLPMTGGGERRSRHVARAETVSALPCRDSGASCRRG